MTVYLTAAVPVVQTYAGWAAPAPSCRMSLCRLTTMRSAGWPTRRVAQELAASWEAIMSALAAGDKPAVAEAALGYAYVWYNFMPLARGSAVVGYITLLGIFLAGGMPVSAPIPKARAWAAACARAAPSVLRKQATRRRQEK